jgi:hypothetical protein
MSKTSRCDCTLVQLNLERRQKRLLAMERAARHSLEEQIDRLRELEELETGSLPLERSSVDVAD